MCFGKFTDRLLRLHFSVSSETKNFQQCLFYASAVLEHCYNIGSQKIIQLSRLSVFIFYSALHAFFHSTAKLKNGITEQNDAVPSGRKHQTVMCTEAL